MKFVVPSPSEAKLSEASQLLGDLPRTEFRRGSIADAGTDCMAAIVHYTIAHDRYGGTPTVGRAQVLQNSRNDGAPPVILATPPLEPGASADMGGPPEVADHVMRMLSMAIAEWIRSPWYPHGRSEILCLLHIEGAGLDFGGFELIARGIRWALAEHVGMPG